MRKVAVAATQMACKGNLKANVSNVERLIRKAAGCGANIILLKEFFETLYFFKDEDPKNFELAKSFLNHPTINQMSNLAKVLQK